MVNSFFVTIESFLILEMVFVELPETGPSLIVGLAQLDSTDESLKSVCVLILELVQNSDGTPGICVVFVFINSVSIIHKGVVRVLAL